MTSDLEVVVRLAHQVFESHGAKVGASKASKRIRYGFRAGGMEGALTAVQALLDTALGREGAGANRVFLRALSLECKENPYVADYYRKASAGLPGHGGAA